TKHYDYDILRRQRYIRDLMRKKDLPAGHTTQTIVGGAGENDKEIFESMIREYRRMDIKRMYYSSFKPVEGTELADKEEVPNFREHRLYQTDWLFRVYDLKPSEISLAFNEEGYLPDSDPKMEIAKKKLDEAVDLNEAFYERLIRVPGIGPKSAGRIVKARKKGEITKWSELSKFGVVLKRAKTFLEVNGWKHSTLDRWSS
ncbi:MAG: helix-hairpin-helix domain-containing protein, partial [Candidatus Natronoplasma sp.]